MRQRTLLAFWLATLPVAGGEPSIVLTGQLSGTNAIPANHSPLTGAAFLLLEPGVSNLLRVSAVFPCSAVNGDLGIRAGPMTLEDKTGNPIADLLSAGPPRVSGVFPGPGFFGCFVATVEGEFLPNRDQAADLV